MERQLRALNQKIDAENQARLESERVGSKFQWANLILVALTLLATLIFGLHSCASTPTNDTNAVQESEFAAPDSVPAELS